MKDNDNSELLALTADIVAAHVSNNSVAVGDLPRMIADVYEKNERAKGFVVLNHVDVFSPQLFVASFH